MADGDRDHSWLGRVDLSLAWLVIKSVQSCRIHITSVMNTSIGFTVGGTSGNFPAGALPRCVAAAGLTATCGFPVGMRRSNLSVRGRGGNGFMSRNPDTAAARLEDKRLDSLPERAKGAVKKVELAPLDTTKARIGRAVKQAIGDDPLRVYGDEGQMSRVITGEKVPDYMARIHRDPDARRRYAIAWLEGDEDVTVTTTITFPHDQKKRAG